MKKVFFLLLITFPFLYQAQAQKYEKLLKYYIEEDYERCANKAYKMTQKSKTKKDPEPYLYVSMANYEMSRREEYYESHPKAFNEAVKFAVKYRKKDKDGELMNEYKRYFSDLRTAIFEEAEMLMDEDKHSKAYKLFKSLVAFDPMNPGGHLFKAYNETILNMRNDANNSLEEFYQAFEAIERFDLLPEDTKRLLKKGTILYAHQLKEDGKSSVAKELMNKVFRYYENDEDFKRHYDEIMGN